MRPKAALGGYLPTLDGWRAVAILSVIGCHARHALFAPTGLHPSTRWETLFSQGSVGVDIFFGISGFLITARLLEQEQKDGRILLASFYVRRVFRILPPALTYVAFVAALGVLGALAITPWEIASCVFFFRNYLPSAAGSWFTGHFWSLAVEEHFYLLWPGLLLVLGRGRRCRWTVVGFALVIAVWRALDFHFHWMRRVLPDVPGFLRTDVRFDALLWGCWMALVLSRPENVELFRRWVRPPIWYCLLAVFAACVLLRFPQQLFCEAVLIPWLLAGTVLMPRGSAGRVLELPPLRWIGRLSYSLYLWQQLFLTPAEQSGLVPGGPLPRLLLGLAGTFLCAAASYYVVERPFIRIGHRLTGRRQGPIIQPSTGQAIPATIPAGELAV